MLGGNNNPYVGDTVYSNSHGFGFTESKFTKSQEGVRP